MALGSHRAPHTQAGAPTPTRGSTHAPKTPNPSPSKPRKAPLTPGRVQRLLANAGTRASLPDQYLPAAQLAQRRMNRRLAQPVTAGSSLTERDLARQTRTAADVRYGAAEQQAGQNVAQAQQVQRDTSDYYDQYLRELAAHQRNVAGYQQQAQTAVQGLSAAGTSLGSGAAQGLLTGENASVAQNASSVRRALTDSFGAMLAAQGANANTYASNQANVVGPGQKLQALGVAQGGVGKARQQLGQLVKERGAFREQLAGETRQSEAKNVLATAIAGGKSVQDQAQLAETVRSHKASETNAAAGQQARQAEKAGTVNKYGYTSADWQAMSTPARQKVIREFKPGARTPKPTRGPGSLNAGAEAKIVSLANRAAALIKSSPTRNVDDKGKDTDDLKLAKGTRKLTDQEIRQELLAGNSPLGQIDPNVVNIAFDLAKYGALSPANVTAAHRLNLHVGGNFKVRKRPAPPRAGGQHGD